MPPRRQDHGIWQFWLGATIHYWEQRDSENKHPKTINYKVHSLDPILTCVRWCPFLVFGCPFFGPEIYGSVTVWSNKLTSCVVVTHVHWSTVYVVSTLCESDMISFDHLQQNTLSAVLSTAESARAWLAGSYVSTTAARSARRAALSNAFWTASSLLPPGMTYHTTRVGTYTWKILRALKTVTTATHQVEHICDIMQPVSSCVISWWTWTAWKFQRF